ELGVPFVDTDRVIVGEHGPIAEIFAQHGEAHFRMLERAAVRSALLGEGVADRSGFIVALGGGAVLDADTRAELESHRVALITVTPQAVRERLTTSKRPLVSDGLESWKRLVAERQPI